MVEELVGGRTERKRAAILGAATEVFLRNGYLGTSMDEIAALAAVSKQTVYKHFADKESLFSEIVVNTVNEISDPNHEAVLALSDAIDVEAELRGFAHRQIERVMQPRLLQLRRLVIGESSRFPELGRLFYQRGAGRTIAALARAFEALAARGELELDDPEVAASQFNWLIMSMPVNQAMLLGEDEPATPAQLDRYLDAGVKTFLRAYRGR
jgi:TetR/AcrR family transcriptional repressor of mexJK operon